MCVTSSTGILPGRKRLMNLQQKQSFMLFAPLSRQQETFDFWFMRPSPQKSSWTWDVTTQQLWLWWMNPAGGLGVSPFVENPWDKRSSRDTIIITYVTTDLQLADPLTKPTSIKINVHLLPLLGLVTCNYITTLALQEEGKESAWSIAFYSAADLLRRVLYALLTTNIRLKLKNWRAEALLVHSVRGRKPDACR